MDNIDLFNNDQTIEIDDVEVVKTGDYIKDDFIFKKEMEQEEIAKLPDYLRNSQRVRETLQQKVQSIIDINNEGLKKLTEPQNKLIRDYILYCFNQKWIIPVTENKKKIYLLETDKEKYASLKRKVNKYLTSTNPDTYYEVSQLEELEKITELDKKYKENEIELDSYSKKINDFFKPYKTEGSSVKKVRFPSLVLRSANMENPKWLTYNTLARESIKYEIRNEQDRFEQVERVVAEPDKLKMVGFFILHPKYSTIQEAITRNPVLYKLEYLGQAKSIKYNQTTKLVEVELKDKTKINNQDQIIIKNSNSYPNIDSEYKNSVKSIKDGFSIQGINKLKKSGTNADIYRILKLDYNTVEESNKNIEYSKEATRKELEERPIFYQFNQKAIDNLTYEKFMEILNHVIPPLEDLIRLFPHKVDNFLYGTDFEDLFSKYSLSYNDFTSNSVKVLQDKLKENIKKAETEETKHQEDLEKETKEQIKERTKEKNELDKELVSILDDSKLKDSEIEKYYGKYPFFNTIYDSPTMRISWIMNKPDHGNFYFYRNLFKDLKEPNIPKKDLEGEISALEDLIKKNEKVLDGMKEQKNFFNANIDIIVFSKGELDDYLNREVGSLALLKHNLIDSEIYELVETGEETSKELNREWRLKTKTTYDSIRDICNFKNIPFENVKEGDLDNFFDIVLKCKTRKYVRLYHRIQKNREELEEQKEQLSDIIDSRYYKDIEKLVEKSKQRLLRYLMLEEDEREAEIMNDTPEKEPLTKFETTGVLQKIDRITNPDEKKELLFQYIDKDGFLIGDKIYSKTTKKPVLCGHYQFLKYQNLVDSLEDKYKIQQTMLDRFGSYNASSSAMVSCRVCGEYLDNVEYDTQAIFSKVKGEFETGVRIGEEEFVSREDLEIKKKLMKKQTELKCSDIKKIILDNNIDIGKIGIAEKVCKTLMTLMSKTGFELTNDDSVFVILNTLKAISKKNNLPKFKKSLIHALKKRGLTPSRIKRFMQDKETVKDKYEEYITTYDTEVNLILAGVFISVLKTAIPQYKKQSTKFKCGYEGIEKIFEYMSCVLNELGLTLKYNSKSKEKRILSELVIINQIKKYTSMLQKRPDIKSRFHQYYRYEKEQLYKNQSKEITIDDQLLSRKFDEDIDDIQITEYDRLPSDFIDEVKSDNYKPDMLEQLRDRFHYNVKRFRYIIHQIIKKQKLERYINPKYPDNPVVDCCSELSREVKGYYDNLMKMGEEGDRLKDIMLENYTLSNYFNLFLNSGSLDIMAIPKEIYTHNSPIQLSSVSEKKHRQIIKQKFETFCYTGETEGELHNFNPETDVCMKCEKSMEEIKNTNFTTDDFDKLLKKISQLTLINLQSEYNPVDFDLSELKKDCNTRTEALIKDVVDNLALYTGKDNSPDFKERYSSLLRNIGRMNKIYEPLRQELVEKDIELNKEKMNENTIRKSIQSRLLQLQNLQYSREAFNLQSYLVNYIYKNISIVQHQYNPKNQEVLMKINTPVKTKISRDDGETKIQLEAVDKKVRNELDKFKFVSLEYLDDTLFSDENIQTFNKLENLFTPNQLETVIGKIEKYDYNKMEVEEDPDAFTSLNSSNLMRYLFIKQLHHYLESNLKQTEYQVVSKFIVILLDLIEKDYNLSVYTKKDIQEIVDKIRFSQEYYSYLQTKKTIPISGETQLQDRDDENQEEQVDMDTVKQNFIEEYRAEHDGEDPDEQTIEDFAEKYQYDQDVDAEIEEDLYDSENVALDAGDYGLAGQEIEDGE